MIENTNDANVKIIRPYNNIWERLRKKINANTKNFIFYIICIFVSRSSIVGEMFPCSIAFLLAYFYVMGASLPMLIVTILSIALENIELKYIGICIFIYLYYLLLHNKKKSKLLINSIYFTSILFTINTVILMFNGFELYTLFKNIFEALFIISLSFIIREVILAIKKNNLNADSTLCLLALIFISILGFKEIQIQSFNLLLFLIYFSIIFVSAYISAFSGMLLGLAFSIINFTNSSEGAGYILALCCSGMFIGILDKKLKLLAGVVYFITNSLILMYFGQMDLIQKSIIEAIVAVIAYSIISFSFNEELNKFSNIGSFYEKKADAAVTKLTKLSNAINEISNAYTQQLNTKVISVNNIEETVNIVYSKVCLDCSDIHKCWKKNHNKTYFSIARTVSNISKGKNAADGYIKMECINNRSIIKEIYKASKKAVDSITYENNSSNTILMSQLKETSEILDETVAQIKHIDIKANKAKDKICELLKKEGILIKSIQIDESKDDINAVITICTDRIMNEVCSIISEAIYKTTGINMKCMEKIVASDKYYILRFTMLHRLSAKAYYAKLTKENSEISGDNYSYGAANNKYYCILCDGMGTGARAFNESKSAISLITKLLEADFNELQMINTLNSLMLLRLDSDRYVTLDFSIIDYDKHELRLYKAGAAQTYIISGNIIKKYQSSSLPIGILDTFECYSNKVDIKSGDIVIMMTDGIIDSINEDEHKSIDKYLAMIKHKDPQSLANSLLTYAVRGSEKILDDMTILAIKII